MVGEKQVAAYFRVSLAREDMKGPEIYRQEIERYCACRSLPLGEVFSDIDYSAFRGARPRPALQELVDRRREFSMVIIPKLSRFGRSVKDLVELFDIFDRDEIPLIFLDMNLDTSTSQGRLLRHVMAAFAEYESDVKADYARANHRRVRSLGLPWGGTPPYGYDRDPESRSYKVAPERAEIVRQIFTWYVAGVSQYEIARRLERLTLPEGSPACDHRFVGRVLDNPAYAASAIVDDEMVSCVWEPIVDRAMWDATRARRGSDTRRRKQLKIAKRGPYLLTGLLYCGVCGRRIHHRAKQNTRDGVYLCVERGGGRCPGGGIDCVKADEYVTREFLDRCSFTSEDLTYPERQRRWEECDLSERRRLLAAGIKRIALTPHAEGDKFGPRKLQITWANHGRAEVQIVYAPNHHPRPKPRAVSNGRNEMMRGLEVRQRELKRRSDPNGPRLTSQNGEPCRTGYEASGPRGRRIR